MPAHVLSLSPKKRQLVWLICGLVFGLTSAISLAPGASAENPVTPGNFTGFGFDQCLTPQQKAMNRWLNHSPYFAVGIYISGKSRACREQPNQTRRWVATQLANGWRILPITLGPQAKCNPRFPRYTDDPVIKIDPNNNYARARQQGWQEAGTAVAAARQLGISMGSTLWYDIEAYDIGNPRCRESTLHFLSSWTNKLHALNYVSGVYSSAGSGIKALDDARAKRPGEFTLPDRIWLARWDGVANTSSRYLRADGWVPGNRVKQYLGGHNETYGNITINIDSNYLDLGKGSVPPPRVSPCGVGLNFKRYESLWTGTRFHNQVAALKCLLRQQGYFPHPINEHFGTELRAAVHNWQAAEQFPVENRWRRTHWAALLVEGEQPVLKFGSASQAVRRVQRALNASTSAELRVTGVFDADTRAALTEWQSRTQQGVTGVVARWTWKSFGRGGR
jgi:hypothetical protein